MDILKRFALIVHWFSFIFGAFVFAVMMITGIASNGSNDVFIFLFAPIFWFCCWGLGWLFRFVVVGKIPYLPWEKEK